MTTAVEGGCLCGHVRYRITGAPSVTSLCHCHSCRHAAGAPVVAWVVFNSQDFAWVGDQPRVYRSSPGVRRTFCGECGTSLTYQSDTEQNTIDVTTASLDSPDTFAPGREIWLSHKVTWMRADDRLPQYPGSSRAGAVS